MPQSLVLLKQLPEENYLHDLQAEGVLRASMNFLPGGCYAGAGLYDASPSYAMSGTSGMAADSTCPDPADTAGCTLWEILETLHKFSFKPALEFNAFVFIEVEGGRGGDFLEVLQRVAGPDEGDDYTQTDRGREYIAGGRLIGCGTYNTLVEVLAEDHDRLLEVVDQVTDQAFVREYSVGRLAAADQRGFGEPVAG